MNARKKEPENPGSTPESGASEKARSSSQQATLARRQARTALRSAADLPGCLDAMEIALRSYAPIDGYMINLYDEVDNSLVCARLHFPNLFTTIENSYTHYSFPIDNQDANTVAFATQSVIRVTRSNVHDFSTATQARFNFWKMQSLVIVPIFAPNPQLKPLGTVVMFSCQCVLPALLLSGVRSILAEAAPLLQLHQKTASLEAHIDSIRIAEHDLQGLLRFIAEMNCLTTDQEIYPRIQREFLNRFDLDMAAVLMAEDGLLRCVDTRSRPEDAAWSAAWSEHCKSISYSLDYCDGATSDAFITNRPLYFANIPSLRNLPMGPQDKSNLDVLKELQTFAIMPIRRHAKPIGVLWLGSMRRLNALKTEQLVMIQHLCDFMGSVIENAHVYTLLTTLRNQVEVLDDLASRDRLTGLYNFGTFEIEVGRRLRALYHHPKPPPMSLIMCDIDYFKRFNDTYGHVAGNVVLQETARRILESVRDSDFVARYGGEEFVILLNGCDLKTATQRAERIRHTVARDPFFVDGMAYPITLSLGCAEYHDGDDSASLVGRADKALYAAKQRGRNCVVQDRAGRLAISG